MNLSEAIQQSTARILNSAYNLVGQIWLSLGTNISYANDLRATPTLFINGEKMVGMGENMLFYMAWTKSRWPPIKFKTTR